MEVGETRARHFLITRHMLGYLVLMHAVLTVRGLASFGLPRTPETMP
jgi:hypothetical protein